MKPNTFVMELFLCAWFATTSIAIPAEPGLVGHWKIAGDARDHSGHGHHATNHNVNLQTGEFNGRDAYLEVPHSPAFNFGKGAFSVAARVSTESQLDDVIGDLVSRIDSTRRKGFLLTFKSNSSGYNSQGNERHLYFGTDDTTSGQWVDCGRPGGVTHCSDALTVFNGDLYVGIVDAPNEADWAHVFRYRGGQEWEDCGRVGSGRTRGVWAMIVHEGALYAGTSGSHGGGKQNQGDLCRVYRYLGGTSWEDLGQPGEHFRINALASFRGKLYACAINTGRGSGGGVYVYTGNKEWQPSGSFPDRPHTMAVHDGKLFAAYPRGEVFAFDGAKWESLGNPYGTLDECNQLHTMGVHRGELYVGTWPKARVAIRRNDRWVDTGRLGDGTEVVGLVEYNGSFYGGTIPRAELFRFDGPQQWTSLRRLFDPPTYNPATDTEDWSRASSLTVYRDKLYVSTATCYRAMLSSPQPDEIRGKVYSFQTGAGVSYDRDLGPGWKHVAAIRGEKTLKIYVDGQLVASQENVEPLDVSTDAPLQIGFGPQSYLRGRLRDVRLYNRELGDSEVLSIASEPQARKEAGSDRGLLAHWKLQGDCHDSSGNGHDGVNHGAKLDTYEFDGRTGYIEVPNSASFNSGRDDFSISAWVCAAQTLTDVPGDIVTKFDPRTRRGFNLSLGGNTSGYNGPGDIRQLFFGIDSGTPGVWTDCGRPNARTHISDAATIFNGDLYVGTTDGPAEADWAHVYRYQGDRNWQDLGRLGMERARGVYAMVVHDGNLFAATSASHGKQSPEMDYGSVYRFRGPDDWEDIGQPGKNHRLNALASYNGKLYVAAFNIGDGVGQCYVHDGGRNWRVCGEFKGYPHTLAVHDGRLYTAYPNGEVLAYDGIGWTNLGNPFGSTEICNQIHAMGVYGGELHASSWPIGRVAVLRDGNGNWNWIDCGRLGDSTEVVGLASYNGTLYAGTIPRAEVLRFDGSDTWTSVRRLFDPPGFEPVPVGGHGPGVADWSRASSLALFQGRLITTTATCYRRLIDTPLPDDVRGKVFSFSTGAAVSHDRDLGTEWKHVVATRRGNELRLHVNGQQVASTKAQGEVLDISNDAPLRIGFGPQSHFCGRIREVRLYGRALGEEEIQQLHRQEFLSMKL